MKRVIGLIAVLWLPVCAFASSQVLESQGQPPQLIELYTSEGCSSCPPADQRIGRLLEDPALWKRRVPVVFHVDYWDYLGWQDRFAQAAFSQRQRRLKQADQISALYTPGWVVDGQEWRGYFNGLPLPEPEPRDGGRLTATVEGAQLQVDYEPPGVVAEPLEAHVAVLGFDLLSPIQGGENRGLTPRHQFVVLAKHKAESDEQARWRFSLPPEAITSGQRRALVVWVKQRGAGLPLQVLGGWIGEE